MSRLICSELDRFYGALVPSKKRDLSPKTIGAQWSALGAHPKSSELQMALVTLRRHQRQDDVWLAAIR